MRLFEVPEGFQILGATDFNCQTIVSTDHGVFIVTEDNVWLKVKPVIGYGELS